MDARITSSLQVKLCFPLFFAHSLKLLSKLIYVISFILITGIAVGFKDSI